MSETEAQRRANLKYRKENVKQVVVAFYPGDADLYGWLCEQPTKAGYIKDLIRKDMEQR